MQKAYKKCHLYIGLTFPLKPVSYSTQQSLSNEIIKKKQANSNYIFQFIETKIYI